MVCAMLWTRALASSQEGKGGFDNNCVSIGPSNCIPSVGASAKAIRDLDR